MDLEWLYSEIVFLNCFKLKFKIKFQNSIQDCDKVEFNSSTHLCSSSIALHRHFTWLLVFAVISAFSCWWLACVRNVKSLTLLKYFFQGWVLLRPMMMDNCIMWYWLFPSTQFWLTSDPRQEKKKCFSRRNVGHEKQCKSLLRK